MRSQMLSMLCPSPLTWQLLPFLGKGEEGEEKENGGKSKRRRKEEFGPKECEVQGSPHDQKGPALQPGIYRHELSPLQQLPLPSCRLIGRYKGHGLTLEGLSWIALQIDFKGTGPYALC